MNENKDAATGPAAGSKHTPGPWVIVETEYKTMISNWSLQIGQHRINFFPYFYHYADESKTCGGYVSDHEMHANFRLIAAAPELLEALTGCVEHLEHSTTQGRAAYESAIAAIAKATGATP